MKNFDSFTNCYSVSKTLRFSLIPVGKTEENFNAKKLLEEDEERAKDYKIVKKYIDAYHKAFIDEVFNDESLIRTIKIDEYAELYYKNNKSDSDKMELEKSAEKLRKQIAKLLTDAPKFKNINKRELLTRDLPEFISDVDNEKALSDIEAAMGIFLTKEERLEKVASFALFSTYFTGFNQNRQNMYSSEGKSTEIAFRCVDDNLPKFLDNSRVFNNKIRGVLSNELEILNSDFHSYIGNVFDIFCVDYFCFILSQNGIELYNKIIGGYTCEDGKKIQGINEYINLYNQKNKGKRLPLLKPLFKQILSDRKSLSFVVEQLESDKEVFVILNELTDKLCSSNGENESVISRIGKLFAYLGKFDLNHIYISAINITDVSQKVFGSWDALSDEWKKIYMLKYPKHDEEKVRKAFKTIKYFSVSELQNLGNRIDKDEEISSNSIAEHYESEVKATIENIRSNCNKFYDLSRNYDFSKKVAENGDAISIIKQYLDSVKSLEWILKPFIGCKTETDKDDIFYGEFEALYEELSIVDKVYDKVRNFVTKKPYSKDKIKLNFENSHFLSGWAQTYDTKGAVLFKKEKLYYLAIIDKKLSNEQISFLKENAEESPIYRIVYDFQKPDNKNTPRLFIRSKGDSFAPAVSQYKLPIEDVIEIYDKGYFKTEYRSVDLKKYKESLKKLIDYFKIGFLNHESYNHYDFKWKSSELYNDIAEFYKDVMISCYKLSFEKVNFNHLIKMADDGFLYLFKIYNKDFSEYSKGTPNLHTLYFRMLFDEKNLQNIVYQLNGNAEMFYRNAQIKYDEDKMKKGHHYEKLKDRFSYPIIKDKRYTKRQFSLHLPITLNFQAKGIENLNYNVRKVLKDTENNYVIGIDRGERNLLYVSVVDSKGKICEQRSLNVIDNGYKEPKNYLDLLKIKEERRDESRKSWTTIESIKELKEGYLSQAIHDICELVLKYNAVIAMEDLNSGFKNSRCKVERQVYQKFEKMLTDKLSYLVDKKLPLEEKGGLLNAYQLCNSVKYSKGNQNGIIFYVPAWLTSKIDPVTGFVDLLRPKYTSKEAAREFFNCFDDIRYNVEENMFEFDADFSKFPFASTSYRKKWKICTNGERIENYRNKNKNNAFDTKTIVLTEEFIKLFIKYDIDYKNSLKQQIVSQDAGEFFKTLISLLKLTLQMRNSVPNSDIDYLVSPVRDVNGIFYDSREFEGLEKPELPENADANGAYNIARKAHWIISERFKKTSDDKLVSKSVKLAISNAEWLRYVQE